MVRLFLCYIANHCTAAKAKTCSDCIQIGLGCSYCTDEVRLTHVFCGYVSLTTPVYPKMTIRSSFNHTYAILNPHDRRMFWSLISMQLQLLWTVYLEIIWGLVNKWWENFYVSLNYFFKTICSFLSDHIYVCLIRSLSMNDVIWRATWRPIRVVCW